MRTACATIALSLLLSGTASAEWQVRPFIGFTFGGATTFVDLDDAAELQHSVLGVSGGWLGEIFGVEGDFGWLPGYFQTDRADDPLILTSRVLTLTGNVVIALPRRMSGYGLRPYFSGGGGLVHSTATGKFDVPVVGRTLPALSFGGGVTGFLTNTVGLNWELRRISTLRGEGETLGDSLGRQQLSFWRATMAVALRY